MKVLKVIKDADLPEDESSLETRNASRAVLFDENNLVPLLFVSKQNYYKLPGGGIDSDETPEEALVRECKEELDCDISILGEIGRIIEFKSKRKFKQTSYCYYGKIVRKGNNPQFTPSEIEKGFEIVWVSLSDAIIKINAEICDGFPFRKERDLACLQFVSSTNIDFCNQ